VLLGGLTTLFAIYWPFKATNSDRRMRGREVFDYKTNNGEFTIGHGETEFTLRFSNASGTSIHFYNYAGNIQHVAIAQGAGQFSDIKDVSAFDYTNRSVTPEEGQIVCVENDSGNYACVHVLDVKHANHGDECYEVIFAYMICPRGGTDFS
jgi:hypothetical protein